jgi:hypothetical protein
VYAYAYDLLTVKVESCNGFSDRLYHFIGFEMTLASWVFLVMYPGFRIYLLSLVLMLSRLVSRMALSNL